MTTLDRREFLRATIAGTAVALTGGACTSDAGYDLATLARPELVNLLGPERVSEIGAVYRQTVPAEATPDTLRTAILAARPLNGKLPWTQLTVDELVREDFAEGRTVLVQGWVLSVTEARQSALFSLMQG
jgi:hypothetical protein